MDEVTCAACGAPVEDATAVLPYFGQEDLFPGWCADCIAEAVDF